MGEVGLCDRLVLAGLGQREGAMRVISRGRRENRRLRQRLTFQSRSFQYNGVWQGERLGCGVTPPNLCPVFKMGIKFRCPNGHKLNVKSFLAGKKGICPHCGVKVVIPEDAEREEAAEVIAQSTAAIGGSATAVAVAPAKSLTDTIAFQPITVKAMPVAAPVAAPVTSVVATPVASTTMPISAAPTMVSSAAAAPVATPVGSPVAAVPVGIPAMPIAAVATPVVAMPTTMPMTMPAMPHPGMPQPGLPQAVIDPIAEAPNAVWYVRPPSGGQFGPARGEIMRKWLGEGRVSSDSLVWRDGWADWKSAVAVFPQLAPVGAVGAIAGPAAPAVAGLPTSAAVASPGRPVRSRRKSNSFAVIMVVSLVVISMVLIGLLVAVLNGLGGS